MVDHKLRGGEVFFVLPTLLFFWLAVHFLYTVQLCCIDVYLSKEEEEERGKN